MHRVEIRGKRQLKECQQQVIRRRSCREIGWREALGAFMRERERGGVRKKVLEMEMAACAAITTSFSFSNFALGINTCHRLTRR